MIRDFKLVRKLIKKNALTERETQMGNLVLEEKSNNVSYKLTVSDIPSSVLDIIAIKSDMFDVPSAFFNCNSGECKRADFVVIARYKNRGHIIFLEMVKENNKTSKKLSPKSDDDFRLQLIGSACLLDYCKSIANGFFGIVGFLDSSIYDSHFVAIQLGNLRKTGWKKVVRAENSTPTTMRKLVVGSHRISYGDMV